VRGDHEKRCNGSHTGERGDMSSRGAALLGAVAARLQAG